jgi:hypothetical protein
MVIRLARAAALTCVTAPRIAILRASSGTVPRNTFIRGELRNAADVTDREAATHWGTAA